MLTARGEAMTCRCVWLFVITLSGSDASPQPITQRRARLCSYGGCLNPRVGGLSGSVNVVCSFVAAPEDFSRLNVFSRVSLQGHNNSPKEAHLPVQVEGSDLGVMPLEIGKVEKVLRGFLVPLLPDTHTHFMRTSPFFPRFFFFFFFEASWTDDPESSVGGDRRDSDGRGVLTSWV